MKSLLCRTQSYLLLSIDIATNHKLITYLRFVLDGEVCSRFLYLVELPGGMAPQIVNAVLEVFQSKSLSLEKPCGVAIIIYIAR